VGMAVPHLTDMAQAGDVGSGCTAALANQDEIENQDENENDEDGFAPMATTSEPTAKGKNQKSSPIVSRLHPARLMQPH